MSVFLFAGDNDVCTPGIEAYIDNFPSADDAMERAEHDAFDWAQIVMVTGLGLQMVNVGKYNGKRQQIIWIHDERDIMAKHSEAEYRQVIGILKVALDAAILLIDGLKLPDENMRSGRQKLLAEMVATSEQIQKELLTADLTHLEAIAICTKDIIRRVHQIGMTPIEDAKLEMLRVQWVASIKSLLHEYEWIRAKPKGIRNA